MHQTAHKRPDRAVRTLCALQRRPSNVRGPVHTFEFPQTERKSGEVCGHPDLHHIGLRHPLPTKTIALFPAPTSTPLFEPHSCRSGRRDRSLEHVSRTARHSHQWGGRSAFSGQPRALAPRATLMPVQIGRDRTSDGTTSYPIQAG